MYTAVVSGVPNNVILAIGEYNYPQLVHANMDLAAAP